MISLFDEQALGHVRVDQMIEIYPAAILKNEECHILPNS